jgi:hypothetical protein
MEIRLEQYKTLSVFWTVFVLIEIGITLFVAFLLIIDIYVLGLYALALILSLNLIAFYSNTFYQSAHLRWMSTMTFVLSSIGIGWLAYTYYIAEEGEFALTTNLITLGLHLIIFWKSDSYYKFLAEKRHQK